MQVKKLHICQNLRYKYHEGTIYCIYKRSWLQYIERSGDGLSPRTDTQNNKGFNSRPIIAESRFNGNLFVGLG